MEADRAMWYFSIFCGPCRICMMMGVRVRWRGRVRLAGEACTAAVALNYGYVPV